MKKRFSPKAGQVVSAVLAVGLMLSCSDPAHDNSEEPLLGVELNFSCSVRQGFHFERDYQARVGYIVSLSIAGQELTPEFQVTDPESQDSTLNVVGVVSAFYWDGDYKSPVNFSCQVSNNNKNTLTLLTHRTLENTETLFEFVIYDYDPGARAYFRCMHSGGIRLKGRIFKTRGELVMSIDSSPSEEVEAPVNYNFNMAVEPAEIHQLIFAASGADKKFVKSWGITAGN